MPSVSHYFLHYGSDGNVFFIEIYLKQREDEN